MAKILIQTPNEIDKSWRECQVIKLSINNFKDSGKVTVKGIASSDLVTTDIHFEKAKDLVSGKEIQSIHKYFKLKVDQNDHESVEFFRETSKFKL